MQLFYPGVGAHAPLPPPKTKLRLGSPMAESSRTRAALAGSKAYYVASLIMCLKHSNGEGMPGWKPIPNE